MRELQVARGTALRRRLVALLGTVAVVTVTVDAGTKALVVAQLEDKAPIRLLGGALSLTVSRNSGAAFSFAQGATVIFTLVALAVIVTVVRTAPRLGSAAWAVTLGLLLGGAIGNLIDRLTRAPGFGRGAVVDFLQVPHFAVFNVADSCITVGAALAVLLSLRGLEIDGSRTRQQR